MAEGTRSALERLLSKIEYDTNGGCWLYSAAQDGRGYGVFMWTDNVLLKAHRASWMFHCGLIPEGMNVLHRCDVRACIRPDHLFVGTYRDNTQDMIAKGRDSPPPVTFGEAQHLAKLTEADVLIIRAIGASRGQREIAADFGVSQPTIGRVLRRQTWRHI